MKYYKNPVSFFNLLLVLLSILVLVFFVLESFAQLDEEMSKLINTLDFVICLVFLLDFIMRFVRAESKLKFMRWGWIDLLASIPSVDILRPGRIFRLIRIFKLFRVIKSGKHLINMVYHNRSQGVAVTMALISILVIMISSVLVLKFESGPDGMINNAEDAIWWSFVTITTVGYGDFYPVTTGGRLVAALLMICGVGLFGTLSASMATWFLSGIEQQKEGAKKTKDRQRPN